MGKVPRAVVASAIAAVPLTLLGCGQEPAPAVYGDCDFVLEGTPIEDRASIPTKAAYETALKALNMSEVMEDMAALLKDSKSCFPADQGNYGGLMIRLAWHCSGTYRRSDGVGGCGGGRMRFEPERSWPDNTNLDKARALVYPLKMKYGDALSWGDLFVLAGHVAYLESGAPLKRMCFGRIDQEDGTESMPLNDPCVSQGNCDDPWGATTVGLIYVNPGGALVDGKIVPDPKLSVAEIRRTFGTMGHSDASTVALIGGGHTIGKMHGACPDGPGNPPNTAFEQGTHIWKGACGTGAEQGRGANTFTSGFEGYWTSNPFTWDNEFFVDLVAKNWTLTQSPAGNPQWETQDLDTIRLTTDLALLEDAEYKSLVEQFAASQAAFDAAFDTAWFDLTTTNVGGEWADAAMCTDGSKPPPRVQPSVLRKDEGPSMQI